ncbi:Lipase 1, partial [Orchesella cincta]
YMLADTGYDVWLGCHRGTSFSLGHRTLNFNLDLNYWEFSFHEKGLFDFPAMVDHARMVSGNEKIFVVAHSEGGSAFLVSTSEIPDMNENTCSFPSGTCLNYWRGYQLIHYCYFANFWQSSSGRNLSNS